MSLGLTLALLVGGICWIAVEAKEGVPDELWIALGALGGVFVGVLIPFPPQGTGPATWQSDCTPTAATVLVASVWVALIAMAVLTVCGVVGDSVPSYAIGGILLGLLIPAPARGN